MSFSDRWLSLQCPERAADAQWGTVSDVFLSFFLSQPAKFIFPPKWANETSWITAISRTPRCWLRPAPPRTPRNGNQRSFHASVPWFNIAFCWCYPITATAGSWSTLPIEMGWRHCRRVFICDWPLSVAMDLLFAVRCSVKKSSSSISKSAAFIIRHHNFPNFNDWKKIPENLCFEFNNDRIWTQSKRDSNS